MKLPFHTPTVVKVLGFVSSSTNVPPTNTKSLTPFFREGQKNMSEIGIGAVR